jgi:hypothetical protein
MRGAIAACSKRRCANFDHTELKQTVADFAALAVHPGSRYCAAGAIRATHYLAAAADPPPDCCKPG